MNGCKVILCLRCCWPGCVETAEYTYYYGVWIDCKWEVEYPHHMHPGRALCPNHAKEGFERLDEVEKEVNAMGSL